VSYAAIGDDRLDDNDLTDTLRMVISLTKSATPGQFEAVAQLINLDSSTTVATITTTLTESTAYQSDLFSYFRSGSVKEEGNFDLFNATAFSYTAAATTP
jgi:acyl-coenzyme A thioesterase PaaI-like protein